MKGDELKKTVEFNKTIENQYLIVSWMPETYAESLDVGQRGGQSLQRASRPNSRNTTCSSATMRTAGDFKKIGEEFAWDLFFANTQDDVVMQMDLGNCLEAGGDPIASLKRFPGRSRTIHLKESGGPDTAVVGEGDVNWKEVFAICETTGGTKWYIVEHETACRHAAAQREPLPEKPREDG